MWRGLLLWNPTMVPCRVIYLFGQGKGAQARGWTDGGGGHREGGTCPPVPPPSDAPARGHHVMTMFGAAYLWLVSLT